ncbi:MAG: ASCH domain-containing protein [Thermodesulfobacteriota bacterium]
MPALNFQKRFAPLIESGQKKQTIRACRKDGRNPRVGQKLFIYTGMRTKGCRKLGEEICRQALPVYMDKHEDGRIDVFVSGDILKDDAVEKLAADDGFEGVDCFFKFFADRMPFQGYLIKW